MKTPTDYLKELDLNDSETELYLTLLKTGPIGVRLLTEKIGMKRTTAYKHVDTLIAQGLVMKVLKGSQSLIAATNPKQAIEKLIEKKIADAKIIEQQFPDIAQALTTAFHQEDRNINDAEILYYKGFINARKIYEEAFSGNEFRSFVKVEEAETLSSDNPSLFHTAFQKNKNLKVWEIIYDSPYSRRQAIKILSQNNNRYFYKFMPSNLKWSITSEDILIYDGRVVIIDYRGPVSIVVLQSATFYNNFKELFDFIWRIIPE